MRPSIIRLTGVVAALVLIGPSVGERNRKSRSRESVCSPAFLLTMTLA